MSILPLLYYVNLNSWNSDKANKSVEIYTKHFNQVHRILTFITFTNTPKGYFYNLVNSYYKLFFMGCIVGYFYSSSFQYILLSFVYVVHYLLLDTVSESLSLKIYLAFRKGFIVVTVFYLMLLFEENTHIFS